MMNGLHRTFQMLKTSGNGPSKAEKGETILITYQRCGYSGEWESM